MDRPLDGRERQYWLIGQRAAVNTLVAARLRGGLAAADLRARLDALQARHPLLGARIEPGPGGPRFVSGAAPVPLRVAPRPDDAAWQREAMAELHAPFPDRSGPLVRAVLLGEGREQDLLLCYHHAIGDVLAGVDLLGPLLGGPIQAPRDAAAEALPVSALLPPGTSAGPGWVLRIAGQALALAARKPMALPPEAVAPVGQRRAGLLVRTVDPATLRAVAARAKAEDTTVHGALVAAGLRAIAAEVAPGRAAWLGCRSPIDLRRHLARPVDGAFGIFAFGMPTWHRVAPGQRFWDLARDVRRQVRGVVDRKEMLPPLLAMEARVPRDPAQAEAAAAQADRLAGTPLVVSNVGVLPDLPAGPVAVEGVAVAASVPVGSGLTVFAGTYRGALTLCFVHAQPLVSGARAARLAGAMLAELAAAAAG